MEGCEGNTTCGNRPESGNDLRDRAYAAMATFTFHWVKEGKAKRGQLQISKIGTKGVQMPRASSGSGPGCGKTINWSKMRQVSVSPELYLLKERMEIHQLTLTKTRPSTIFLVVRCLFLKSSCKERSQQMTSATCPTPLLLPASKGMLATRSGATLPRCSLVRGQLNFQFFFMLASCIHLGCITSCL